MNLVINSYNVIQHERTKTRRKNNVIRNIMRLKKNKYIPSYYV